MTTMMKAAVLAGFGGPEVFSCTEVTRPEPGEGEVLVRIRCCGVCHLDLILRKGMRSRVKPPRIIGHEIAGDVVALGAGVRGLRVRDRVASFNFQACGACPECARGKPSLCRRSQGDIGQTRDGGYAEFAVLKAENLVKIPQGMAYDSACFGACVYAPPYKAIRTIGRIGRGDPVVVTGASGGLGIAALQILAALGARSIAITSSPSKVARLKEIGASDVIVSTDGAFGEEVRALTDGRGVDLVVELIGSPTFHGALRALAPGGRVAVIGELSGTPVSINLGLVILKEWGIFGIQSASGPELSEVLTFMHEAKLRPVIEATLPLDAVGEAHRMLESRAVMGRILLKP